MDMIMGVILDTIFYLFLFFVVSPLVIIYHIVILAHTGLPPDDRRHSERALILCLPGTITWLLIIARCVTPR